MSTEKEIKMSPEIEAAIRKKYEQYCVGRYRAGGAGTKTYEQFKKWLIDNKMALF